MSNPSFDNIDKWLFEYSEGNLSSSQISQLELFILQNPDLEKDLDAWTNAKVDATPVVYPHIDSHTKKPVAWYLPAVWLVSIVAVGSLSWLTLDSFHPDMQFANSAHTIEAKDSVKNSSKAKSYFVAKNRKERISQVDYKINSGDFWLPTFNAFQNYGPFCGGVIQMTDQPFLSNFFSENGYVGKGENGMLSSLESQSELKKDEILATNNSEIIAKDAPIQNSIQEETAEKNASAMSRTQNKFGTSFNKSFTSKVKSMMRKIVRMTDNPIALINSKDIYYHTPGMQTLVVNFGSVGSLLTSRVQTVTRAQWTGHGNQQFGNQISFDTYVKNIRGGIGVQLNHVHYGNGAYQVGQFALMYSPKFVVTKNVTIEPAIRFKMGNKRLDNQKMQPGQHVEFDRQNVYAYNTEGELSTAQDLWYKDIGFALMSNTKWFSAGIQFDNLGRHYSNVFNPSGQNSRASQHFTATVGTDYVSRSKLFSFSPYIMYQKVENLSEIWGGSIFRYKKFTIGGGISSYGDYAGSIGIKTNRLMITYAVDNTQSVLLNQKLFSQQLTLRILTNRDRNGHRMLK